MPKTSLGQLVRRRRQEKELTIKALARKIGYSTTYLSRLETGTLSSGVGSLILTRLATELNVPLPDLAAANKADRGQDVGPDQDAGSEKTPLVPLTSFGQVDFGFREVWFKHFDAGAQEWESVIKSMKEVGDSLLRTALDLRSVLYASDLGQVIPLMRMSIAALEVAHSNRSAIARTHLASTLYSFLRSAVEGSSQDVEQLDGYKKVLEEMEIARRELGTTVEHDIEFAWARFWCLRQMASLVDYLAQKVISAPDPTELYRLVAQIATLGNFESRQNLALQLLTTMPDCGSMPMDEIVRVRCAGELIAQALGLYIAAESQTIQSRYAKPGEKAAWDQQCLWARWQIDQVNVVRDRLCLAEMAGNWSFLLKSSLPGLYYAQRGSLEECETQMRATIVEFRAQVSRRADAERTQGVILLSYAHQELGYLIRRMGKLDRYRDAMWNHLVAGALDPLRDERNNRHNTSLLMELQLQLRSKQYATMRIELETKRLETDFSKFDYAF